MTPPFKRGLYGRYERYRRYRREGGITIKKIKSKNFLNFLILILLNIIVFGSCLTFYACQNISAQDFGPDDIINIIEVLINKDNYATNNAEDNPDDDFFDGMTNPIDSAENTGNTESTGDTEDSTEPVIPESTEPTEQTEPAEPPTVPSAQPPTQPANPDPTDSSLYYETGDATVINIREIFPDAPEKFWNIAFPESVPMTDSLKKNIKNLADYSPRTFSGMSFYIATTDTNAKLITPKYGGGMLSDSRRYRTDIVNAECNTEITCIEKPRNEIVEDIRLKIQADEFYADILCVPFDVQSELIKHGLLMNLKKTPFLNLNADYYNSSATEAFTVNGNIFGVVSDLTFDPSTIYAMYYNRSLVNEYGLTDPLRIYQDGKWNYDSMFDISKELTAAVAGLNGENNSGGQIYSVGIDKESSDIINGLFISSGGKYFTKSNSYPNLNYSNEKTLKLIDTISKMFYQPWENNMTNFLSAGQSVQEEAFANGNILFSVSRLDMIQNITDSSFDWGILPVPNLDGISISNENENGNLYSSANRDALSMSILKGTRNAEACGIVLSALSSASHGQLKDIYVKEQMTFHLRDVDSVLVLKDIVNNVTYNQYQAYSSMLEVYSSTTGLLKESVNKRMDFSAMYEINRAALNEFFRESRFFDRD